MARIGLNRRRLRIVGSRLIGLISLTAMPVWAATEVQFVEPETGHLRSAPATEAQAKAFSKLDLDAMPYRDAVVHVLPDGTVRVRLGRALRHASHASLNPDKTRQDAHDPH